MHARVARLTPTLLGGALLTAAGCGGAGPTAAADPRPATFRLVAIGTRPVPAALSATAGGRTIELVGATLRFDDLGGRAGAVAGVDTVRVSDPGAAPVTDVHAVTGRSTRRGDSVAVVFSTGASSTYVLEDGGTTLRTVASDCGPNPCTDVLLIYVFRRVPAGS